MNGKLDKLMLVAFGLAVGAGYAVIVRATIHHSVVAWSCAILPYVGVPQGKASLTTISSRLARSGKLASRYPKARRVMVVRLDRY
jgi:hypothetical protein